MLKPLIIISGIWVFSLKANNMGLRGTDNRLLTSV